MQERLYRRGWVWWTWFYDADGVRQSRSTRCLDEEAGAIVARGFERAAAAVRGGDVTAVELEVERRAAARAMFRRLATGEEQSRSQLFTGCAFSPTWQSGLMRCLLKIGIVDKIGETGRWVRWRLARTDEAATYLQALSTDDEALASLMVHVGKGSGAGALMVEGAEESDPDEGEVSAAAVTNGVGDGDDDVRLDFVLKLLAAVLENIVYLREETKAMSGKLDRLEEAFK